MMQLPFKSAFLAALLTFVMAMPIIGLPVVRQGIEYHIEPNFTWVIIGTLLVFLIQLTRPLLARPLQHLKLPAAPSLPGGQARIWLTALVIMIAIVWPFFANRGAIDIATLTLIYIMLGLGLNIVVGFAGLLDLGFVGFYAVGAYTYALLYHWAGWGFWEALPLAGLIAAIFGFVLGFPVLRLRGDYLAIVTLGFGEIIRLMLINLAGITGGPDGISGIPKPTFFGFELARRASDGGMTFNDLICIPFKPVHVVIFLYLMALLLAIITLLISNRLIRMPIGRTWEALREDEIACRSLGINPMRIKLSAFTLGAMFAGFGGAFFAARQGMVNPESFTFIESALILAIVVLGGMGSQLGVILAAIFITVVPELFRDLAEYRMLIFGLIMVLMMNWRPQGLLPMKRVRIELKS